MIVALVEEKGGVGKTTLALNLAVWRAAQGRRVLLVDADKKQASASSWVALRMAADLAPGITCVMLDGEHVRAQVSQLAPLYDDVVIDGRGSNDPGLLQAMAVANVALSPVKPGQFDLNSMANMAEMAAIARGLNPGLDAVAVINQALTNDGDLDALGAQEAIRNSVPVYRLLPGIVHSRKAFSRCAATGRAVMEIEPSDAKAIGELDQLAQEVWK
jgi:chromosome partitioning protein